MLITHNAFELLVTPGRITLLGEVDGNRMRRIYLDGRPHPEDPDLTLHGHSIGSWEGDTLVVDTTAIAPQAFIATSEAAGIPNDGDMHIVERIHLAKPNVLADEMAITAPLRDGSAGGYLTKVTLPSGQELSYSLTPTEQ